MELEWRWLGSRGHQLSQNGSRAVSLVVRLVVSRSLGGADLAHLVWISWWAVS